MERNQILTQDYTPEKPRSSERHLKESKMSEHILPAQLLSKWSILFGFAINLSCGSSGDLMGRNLSTSLGLPIITIKVVRTSQMVFTIKGVITCGNY
jgi:hypothetical protein